MEKPYKPTEAESGPAETPEEKKAAESKKSPEQTQEKEKTLELAEETIKTEIEHAHHPSTKNKSARKMLLPILTLLAALGGEAHTGYAQSSREIFEKIGSVAESGSEVVNEELQIRAREAYDAKIQLIQLRLAGARLAFEEQRASIDRIANLDILNLEEQNIMDLVNPKGAAAEVAKKTVKTSRETLLVLLADASPRFKIVAEDANKQLHATTAEYATELSAKQIELRQKNKTLEEKEKTINEILKDPKRGSHMDKLLDEVIKLGNEVEMLRIEIQQIQGQMSRTIEAINNNFLDNLNRVGDEDENLRRALGDLLSVNRDRLHTERTAATRILDAHERNAYDMFDIERQKTDNDLNTTQRKIENRTRNATRVGHDILREIFR